MARFPPLLSLSGVGWLSWASRGLCDIIASALEHSEYLLVLGGPSQEKKIDKVCMSGSPTKTSADKE